MKWDGAGGIVAVKNARVETRLATKSGIETGRLDAKYFGDLGDAYGVVAMCMEQTLSGSDREQPIIFAKFFFAPNREENQTGNFTVPAPQARTGATDYAFILVLNAFTAFLTRSNKPNSVRSANSPESKNTPLQ